ncbi:MAG: sulfatase [Bacteroidota bacterium]
MKFIHSNIIYRCISLLVLCLIASCTDNQTSSSPIDKKPNVILIVVDDWGWKDAGFLGSQYYETPNLDAFAKEGMVFTHAYAAAANCAPSRACMLSGRNTPYHGVYTVSPSDRGNAKTRKLIPIKNTDFLANEEYTLPQMMKNAGYVTGNFGKWHIGEDPTLQGIDYNIGGSHRGNPGKNGYFSPYKIDHITDGPEGEYLTDRLASEAIQFVEQHQDSTFFLYLPFYTVHTPILGKEELIEKYKDKAPFEGHRNPVYGAMVSSMDENIGRLLDRLKDLNLYDNSIIILTSDNGGLMNVTDQRPLRAGKGAYYEGGIRVPLVMKWKNHIPENTRNAIRVSNLDFYPTLQEIVKPKKRAINLEGSDLSPLFAEQSLTERSLYFHFPIYLQSSNTITGLRDPLFRTRPGSVIIDENWKLHHYFEDDELELYDLNNDPSESNNLAEVNPVKRDELYQKLDNWRKEKEAAMPDEINPLYDAIFTQNKSKEKLEKANR